MRSTTGQYQMRALALKVLADRNAEVRLGEQLATEQLAPDDRRAIIELVAAELCEKGFDADSEPTAYGQELERLIDYLNRPNLT